MDTWPHASPCAKPRAYLINSPKKTQKNHKTNQNPKQPQNPFSSNQLNLLISLKTI